METVRILGRAFGMMGTLAMAMTGMGCASQGPWKPLVSDSTGLRRVVEESLAVEGQPSAACALARAEGPMISAAAGLTRADGGLPVTEKSLYHIGSVSKSMTALLAAILIERGSLSLSTRLAEALPGQAMRAEYRDQTILDLMLSRAGIIPFQATTNEDPAVVQALWTNLPAAHPDDPAAQRAAVAAYALALPPIGTAGEEPVPVYSNVSWAILGHILERAAGMPYEDAIRTMVFEPLGIRGYKIGGWPRDDYAMEEPLGHYPPAGTGSATTSRPQGLADGYRFPDWVNPAGGVNIDLKGFSLYLREHLRGLAGEGVLLSKASYATMHSVHAIVDSATLYQGAPAGQAIRLGLGWDILETASGPLSYFDGTGGTFYARAVVFPALDIAFAGLTNSGDGNKVLSRVIKGSTGFDFQ